MQVGKESQITIEQNSVNKKSKKGPSACDIKLGSALGDLRRVRHVTQDELSEIIGVSTKTVQNYENGRTRPPMSTFIQIMRALDATDDEKASLLSLAHYPAKSEQETISEQLTTYRDELFGAFEGQHYKCLFVSNHRDDKMDIIEIEELHSQDDGSLSAEAIVRNRKYICKVIPSLEGSYAFFNLACQELLHVDRCLMILPRNKKIRRSFDVGIAAILSLAPRSDDDSFFPSFQLCAIISDNYYTHIKDSELLREACLAELELPKTNDPFHIHLSDIRKRSAKLYHSLKLLIDTDSQYTE